MKSVYIVLYFAFLGKVTSQFRRLDRNRILEGRPRPEREPQLSALDRMKDMNTMDEFLSLLMTNGRPVTEHDIYQKYPSLGGRRIAAQGGYMAEPDPCSPREMTVELEVGEAEHGMVYFPRCTKVLRCGGCWSSRHVCKPKETRNSILNVVKGYVPFNGSDHLVFSGFQKVLVEQHLSCELKCDLSEEKCGDQKIFLPDQCACSCAKIQRCNPDRKWDPETCRCACARTKKCPSGKVLNQGSCQCEVDFGRQEVSHDVPSSANDVNKYLNQNRRARDHGGLGVLLDKPPETDSFGPAVLKSTARPTRQGGECSALRCPPSFNAVKRFGLCVCSPKASRGPFHRRRPARDYPRRQPRRQGRRRWRQKTRKQARRMR